MNERLEQETDIDIIEMVEAVSFDDIDNDIREWLQQTQPVQIKDYGFNEVDREKEYLAILNEIADILIEK